MHHPSAFIHPKAKVGMNVEIGPYAVVDANAIVEDNCCLGSFSHLHSGAHLHSGVIIHEGVIVGSSPQDLKYRGEPTSSVIGAGAVLREYVTVNRATSFDKPTSVGTRSMIMTYSHIAHDCEIGEGVIVANHVQMGGHVRIGNGAVISGMTGIHQFVSIGAFVFIGGHLRVDKDIPPGIKALGDPLSWGGINRIGLVRAGFSEEEIRWLDAQYRKNPLGADWNWDSTPKRPDGNASKEIIAMQEWWIQRSKLTNGRPLVMRGHRSPDI